jgi:hypothetical protein
MNNYLYGLYSFINDKPNDRKTNIIPNDFRLGTKEFKYIHDLPNFGIQIINHLLSKKKDNIYYKDIKSYIFIPFDESLNNENNKIQQYINYSYRKKISDLEKDDIELWTRINFNHRLTNRGYTFDLSEEIINNFSNNSKCILNKFKYNKEILDDKRFNELNKSSLRSCDNIHNIEGHINKDIPYTKILLEDEVIKQNEKQLLLSSMSRHDKYLNNNKILISPWIDYSARMGYMSWSIPINKASISCIINNNPIQFPIRLLLETHPNNLFYENRFDEFSKNEDNSYKYMGFFIIKYKLNESHNNPDMPENIDDECKHLYLYTNMKTHKSKEQYYVLFVFKNNKYINDYDPWGYHIVNFRLNIVAWGDVKEWSRYLSFEIRQLMCSQVYFYMILKENVIDDKECKSQYEDYNEHKKCIKAWIHSKYYNLLKNYSFDDDCIHILISKHKLTDNIYNLQYKNEKIEYQDLDNGYCLFKCYFTWNNDPIDRFLITFSSKEKYIPELCIKNKCIVERDYIKNLIQNYLELKNENEIEIFSNKKYMSLIQNGGKINDKINKYFNKYLKIVNKYNLLDNKDNVFIPGDSKLYSRNYVNKKQNIFYDLKKNQYYKGENLNKNTDFITDTGIFSLIYLGYLTLNNILIISQNINFVDKIASIFKNICIYFFVFNNTEIGSFILLKKKYPFINIYFIGNKLNIYSFNIINKIIKNKIFNTIVIDLGNLEDKYIHINGTIFGILLSKKYLDVNNIGSCYIKYSLLPINKYDIYTILLNIEYDYFQIHNNNDTYWFSFVNRTLPTLFIYNNFKNINNNYDDLLLSLLSYNNENINYKLTYNFIKFICNKWKQQILTSKELLLSYNQQKGGNYHGYSSKNFKYNLPITINDLTNNSIFNGNAKDIPPLCHWGQKKLLLSEIQFLTNICIKLNIKNLKDYVIIYIGSADGTHLPILFNMFPELEWHLYDPNPFSKNVKKYGKNKVFIYNEYFTNESINNINKKINKKIIFISDIRVTPKDEQVMKDMIDQGKWGIDLNAEYMLLKFRLPYNEPGTYRPLNINDLKFNKKFINNYNLIANNCIYLKGTIFLQLFHPTYSTELRLFVEKSSNNKYDLDDYNFIEIENKLFNYNSEIRGILNNEDYNFLNLIPGYDTSIECILEYNIIKKYYEYFFNYNNNQIINKLFEINLFLEKLTHKQFLICNYENIKKNIIFLKDDRKIKAKIWKKIIKVNISHNILFQKIYIQKYGNNILDKNKYNYALTYLDNFKFNKLYYKLK